MIQIMKEIQELFCETDEQVEQILESAKNNTGKELVGKEVKKRIKKYKLEDGTKEQLEYYQVKLTYNICTINDIVEQNYM